MENRKLRIAFLGLGGVGGYFGAKLSRTSAEFIPSDVEEPGMTRACEVEVVFFAREKTATTIRADGIKLITPEEEIVARPHLVVTPREVCPAIDFLICAVKSYDLEESLEQFRSCVSSDTIILPLLNGIDAEDKIRGMFPENEVWSGCVYIVSRLTAPGVITETGNIHRLHFGGNQSTVTQSDSRRSQDKCDELYQVLKVAHDDIFLHKNIRDVVWEKFIFISTIASLTSYLDVCIGKILEHDGSRKLLQQLLEEICAVARAEKIVLPEDIISTTLGKMEKLPYETTSSMHSDFQRGGKTEHGSLTAHVVKLAERHGIAIPTYKTILSGLELRSHSALM